MRASNPNPTRLKVLSQLADFIHAVSRPHTTRVAIDGIDAAGNTTLADELVPLLERRGRHVLRASIDGFHHVRTVRYRRGHESAEGYYSDSFDTKAVISSLLGPLGPDGNGVYRLEIYDHVTDSFLDSPLRRAPADTVLLFDGVFLLRPELRRYWDFKVFVDVPFVVALARALQRDFHGGNRTMLLRRYQKRYLPGQQLYLRRCRPKHLADLILDNEEFGRPSILARPSA